MVCQNCGRKLKDAVSIERGYGPVCYGRIQGSSYGSHSNYKKIRQGTKALYIEKDINIPGQMSIEDYPEFII